jgi:cytochrome c-type biogenesis protein CcmF
LALFLGAGQMMNWKKTNFSKLLPWLLAPLLGSVICALTFPMFGRSFHWGIAGSVFLGSWVILACFSDLIRKLQHSTPMISGLRKLTPSYYGMLIAHIGFAFTLMGATIDSLSSDERDLRMVYGERQLIGGYEFELVDVISKRGPNYDAQVGEVNVYYNNETVVTLYPEKRTYLSEGKMVMTEPGIDPGFTRDLFVALGDKLDNRAWSMRINHYPLVRWIWLGAILMAIGGTLAILDKRYRAKSASTANVAATEPLQGEMA